MKSASKEFIFLTKLTKFLLFGIVLLLFCFFLQNSKSFENGVYQKYAISIVEDGDFNLFNQFTNQKYKWLITQSGNHPDFHHEAVGTILIPFYLLIKAACPPETWIDNLYVADCLVAVLFFLLSLNIWITFFKEDNLKHLNFSNFLLAACTPIGISLFLNPTDTAIIVMFFTTVFLKISHDSIRNRRISLIDLLILGFICILKTETVFLLPIAIYLSINLHPNLKKKIFALFYLSIFPILFLANSTIKFGRPSYLIQSIFQTDHPYILDNLSSIDGFLYYSPVYLILLLALAFHPRKIVSQLTHQSLNFGILAIVAVIICVAQAPLKFTINLLDRHLVPYSFVILYLFRSLLFCIDEMPKRTREHFQWLIAITLLWSCYTKSYLIVQSSSPSIFENRFFLKGINFLNQYPELLSLRWNQLLTKFPPPLLLLFFVFLILFAAGFALNLNSSRVNKSISIFFAFLFAFSVALNGLNNQKNVNNMRNRDEFKNAVVCANQFCFYDDFMDVLTVGAAQYAADDDALRSQILNQKKIDFINSNRKNILFDPIGFLDDFDRGIIRQSFWQRR